MEEVNLVFDFQQKKFFIYVDIHFYKETDNLEEALEFFKEAYEMVAAK